VGGQNFEKKIMYLVQIVGALVYSMPSLKDIGTYLGIITTS
jgi:hypothetical protein